MEIVGVDEFTLNEYCHLLSKKTLSLLYQIEELLNSDLDYEDVKKYIFNLAGSIERLPDNLIDENAKDVMIKKPDKNLSRVRCIV